MKEIIVKDVTQATETLEENNKPHLLIMTDVAQNATINCELIPETDPAKTVFRKINHAYGAEVQNKVEAFLTGKSVKKLQFKEVAAFGGGTIAVIETSVFDLGFNGEIPLGKNDQYKIQLENLGKSTTATALTLGSTDTATAVYSLQENTFKADDQTKEIDLSRTSFLAFDVAKMPSKVEFLVNGRKVEYTIDILKSLQKDHFGVIAHVDGTNPIIGYNKAIVLDVRQATSVYLRDDRDVRVDIKFHSL